MQRRKHKSKGTMLSFSAGKVSRMRPSTILRVKQQQKIGQARSSEVEDILDMMWQSPDGDVYMDIEDVRGVDYDDAVWETIKEWRSTVSKRKRKDTRRRRDRIARHAEAFQAVMEPMVDAYLKCRETSSYLRVSLSAKDASSGDGMHRLIVWDPFYKAPFTVSRASEDTPLAAKLVQCGIIPSSPERPSVGFSLRLMEQFHLLRVRCPQLSIERFAKCLQDAHFCRYAQPLRAQLTQAYDVYLEILRSVEGKIMKVLGRDSASYRINHSCPPCTYKLQHEAPMAFNRFFAMDGNDSLKRVERRRLAEGENTWINLERYDPRVAGRDYFLESCEVEKIPSFDMQDTEGENHETLTGCETRWKNMSSNSTKRAHGIFSENGIFCCVCRHGFISIAIDMIRSGEQSRYPVAVVQYILEHCGSNNAIGYDLGCRLEKTINKTSDLQCDVKAKNLKVLVDLLHGFAHIRTCQLEYLLRYIPGVGLEDLGGCERLFSRTNGLAAVTRYASPFHRRQMIAEWFRHTDRTDAYAQLGKFLVSNYNQAQDIIGGVKSFEAAMASQNISNPDEIIQWKADELRFLLTLSETEPEQTTREIEYYESLVKLYAAQDARDNLPTWYPISTLEASSGKPSSALIETKRRHILENLENALANVQRQERLLELPRRWARESPDMERVKVMARERKYRQCLHKLGGLVLQRLFELQRANERNGYKARTGIAKSLRARTTSIKNLIENHNKLARQLDPPAPVLQWEDISDIEFLAQYEVLLGARQTHDGRLLSQQPWAQSWGRRLMDEYFLLERAKEELVRVEVETKRLLAYMVDERLQFSQRIDELNRSRQSALAFEVFWYGQTRFRFDGMILAKLLELPFLQGDFTCDASQAASSVRKDIYTKDQIIEVLTSHPMFDLGNYTEQQTMAEAGKCSDGALMQLSNSCTSEGEDSDESLDGVIEKLEDLAIELGAADAQAALELGNLAELV